MREGTEARTVGAADAGHDHLSALFSAGCGDPLIVCGHNHLAQGFAKARLLPGAHHHGHPQNFDQRLAREADGLVARWYDSNLQS